MREIEPVTGGGRGVGRDCSNARSPRHVHVEVGARALGQLTVVSQLPVRAAVRVDDRLWIHRHQCSAIVLACGEVRAASVVLSAATAKRDTGLYLLV